MTTVIGRLQGTLNQPHGIPQLDKDQKIETPQLRIDEANGIAGLDSNGDILARGPGLKLVRDGSNDVVIVERTSNEQILAMRRNGVADYLFRIFDGGAAHEVQNASMKDAANGIAGLDAGAKLSQAQIPVPLKLLTPNADALTIGSPTEEGGDLKIYRNASGDLQVYIDADAASNAKALDIYGGVVIQNYLTVGQNTLNTAKALYVDGTVEATGPVISGADVLTGIAGSLKVGTSGIVERTGNQSSIPISILVHDVDTTDHDICLQIDSNNIICAHATGDGSGGIVGKRSIQYGGQCHAKTDAGAADYNPSVITSDYIISVDTTAAARAVTISTEDRDSGAPTNVRVFIIQDIAGNAGANNITISLETAGTINGAANTVINSNYGAVTLMIDGTNGFII